MAQIKRYTVGVTNASPTVVCSPTLQFTPTELAALVGASFKVQGEPVVYTIAGYTAPVDPVNYYTLTLSAPYAGSPNAATPYQIGVDYTPNLQLAEINAGDQDWADHLTQEVIRKLDTVVGLLASANKVGTVYASADASPPALGTWVSIGTQTIGTTTVTYYKRTA